MVDTFRTLYPFEDKVKTRGGTRKACKGKKIDYIFSEPSTRVLEADILRIGSGGRKASDHCPVTATLLID
jgi:exonuclease III